MDTSAGITYKPLEQDYLNKITDKPISFDVSTSFGDVSIFLFTTFFAVIVAAAFGRYVMAGVYRIQASVAETMYSNVMKRKLPNEGDCVQGFVFTSQLFLE
jgi:hypothetical protein